MARSADSTLNTFGCPFADRCSCRVKFRIAATAFQIKLEGQGEHTAESHVQDKVAKFLTIQQSSALEHMVSTNTKKPHLKDKILQCAAHLTGIAWQKRSHTQSPCPCLPIPDLKHGSRLARLVVATTRHAARHRSHHPSSASHHSPWNRRPQPSPRSVIYASTVHCSQLLSLYVCMQARVTRASSELLPTGRAKRVAKVLGR